MRNSPTTTKKAKIIGTEQRINPSTGEIEDMQVIKLEERDFNFTKIWVGHILSSLNLIGNRKTQLAFWIIDNLDGNNRLIKTQRQMAEALNISIHTVSATIKALVDSNFLCIEQSGVYRVNPQVLFKGKYKHRMNVLIQYHKVKEAKKQ